MNVFDGGFTYLSEKYFFTVSGINIPICRELYTTFQYIFQSGLLQVLSFTKEHPADLYQGVLFTELIESFKCSSFYSPNSLSIVLFISLTDLPSLTNLATLKASF